MNRLLRILRNLRLPALVLACSSCSAGSKLSAADRIKLEEGALAIACAECAKDSKCPPDAVAFCDRLDGTSECGAAGASTEGSARGSVAPEDGGAQ